MKSAWTLPAVLVFLFARPAWPEEAPPSAPKDGGKTPPAVTAEAAERHARVLQGTVVRLRGLEFKHDVAVRTQNEADLRKMILAELGEELPTERLAAVQKAGAKLGIFPEKFDLRASITEVLTEQIAGFYDPRTKELYVIRRSGGGLDGVMAGLVEMMTGLKLDDVIAVHELTHAAQDQHFDLETLPMETRDDDDLVIALKAVVEGDASYVMYDYMSRAMERSVDDLAVGGGPLDSLMLGAMGRAPEYLRESLIFPYAGGFNFIKRVKAEGGWARVAALYDDPPASSEQILHPEKYLAETRDAPIRLRWGPLPSLPESAWTLLDGNVLGEFGVRILLKVRGRKPQPKAAAGWGGDRYQVYERKEGGRLLLLWATTWDTEEDAREFAEAAGAMLARPKPAPRGAAAKGPAPPPPAIEELKGPTPAWRGRRAAGADAAWVVSEGRDVFVIDGADGAEAPAKLVDEWRERLLRETVTRVLRVPRKPARAEGEQAGHEEGKAPEKARQN